MCVGINNDQTLLSIFQALYLYIPTAHFQDQTHTFHSLTFSSKEEDVHVDFVVRVCNVSVCHFFKGEAQNADAAAANGDKNNKE